MDYNKFKEFSKVAQENAKVTYNLTESKPYEDIIDEIYKDVSKFKYHTLDGRLQNIIIDLLRDKKYELEGYNVFLRDLELELKKLIVPNIILLPINFIKSSKFNTKLSLNEYINLFIPNDKNLKVLTTTKLDNNKNLDKFNEDLSIYFKQKLKCKLNKEHIIITKDRNFFNYPILTIFIKNVDYRVEKEAKRITEAVYSILRMIDFIKREEDYGWGLLDNDWQSPAHTYTVYYNEDNYFQNSNNGYDGLSYRFNFSHFLDIDTDCLIANIKLFSSILDTFIKSCFIDSRDFSSTELNTINKWSNAILLFNTAFEFASIEKYDSCILILSSILESLFLKNVGRNKSEKLKEKINNNFSDFYEKEELEDINKAITSVYKFRNKIMHEGRGYECEFLVPRGINSYQGIYRGMKPFYYEGSVPYYPEIIDIMIVFKFIIEILIRDKSINDIKTIIDKNSEF